MKLLYTLLPLLLFASDALCQEAPTWKLPIEVNDSNTKVEFNVDTTWHVVTGKISGTSGFVKPGEAGIPRSIAAEIHFPVAKFDTGWDMRDESLHEHMAKEEYPEVVLTAGSIGSLCAEELAAEKPCTTTLAAKLKIRDVEKEISLPIEIKQEGENIVVSGDYTLQWAEYNVEDPSILVAKVDPEVTISYSLELPLQNANE